jgi:glycosyltransferase involved in cell wall biosynthesis
MNVLISATAYPPSTGGAQLLMHQLARQLSTHCSVQVLSQWDTNRTDWLLGTTLRAPAPERAYQIDGIPVQRITLSGKVRRELWPWVMAYYPLQGPALARISEAFADVIGPWAARADLVHNCRIGREGLSFGSFQAAARRGIPFVLTPVHHPRWSGWSHRYYQQLYRQADAVIALTDAERQVLVRLGVSEKKVFVTGMGPVLAENGAGGQFRQHYNLKEDPLILFLGQKYEYKGLAALLAAADLVWRKIPEAHFAFIGPRTPFSRRLFQSITDLRILELDTVSLQEKTDALAACTLLCVPSTQESFGGVYTEAWSFERPVIGCRIPAVAEVISSGVDGFLVDQQPAPIADRIIQLVLDSSMADKMGKAGLQKVTGRYTWERLAEKTELVYRQLISS